LRPSSAVAKEPHPCRMLIEMKLHVVRLAFQEHVGQ
jgi:hypothetical protein